MTQSRIRILHAVVALNRAGTETWLLNVLRHIDRDKYQMDFMTNTTERAAYDEIVEKLGSRVIPIPDYHRHPWSFTRHLRSVFAKHGAYDIVHSQVDHRSGFVLRAAHSLRVPTRIAHSHMNAFTDHAAIPRSRMAYYVAMRYFIRAYATHGLAASPSAARSLYGKAWRSNPRWQVLPCGVDLAPFSAPVDRAQVREELGIPRKAFVIGHVGRLGHPKNHPFLVQIAAEAMKREPSTCLLLVGDGSLAASIRRQARELRMEQRVIIAGSRPDVPRLLMGAMDIFVFPSLYEGLGLALVEAQAAGLPCVYSDCVPAEADVVAPLLHRESLLSPASHWAEAVLRAWRQKPTLHAAQARVLVEQSPFCIQTSVSRLEEFYDAAVRLKRAA